MGCRLAKHLQALGDDCRRSVAVADIAVPESSAAAAAAVNFAADNSTMSNAQQVKSRLERLMCVARDTPEPIFELTECDLKTVPAGVFILCRVLRKERLDLRANRLKSLHHGGSLSDLMMLTHLDLSANAFQALPDELTQLVNLQELLVRNNQICILPANLNRLHRLELLDVSENRLIDIRQIACMNSLRILNICDNRQMRRLPMELATCSALDDIVCDATTLQYPPGHVIERGTQAILAFLLGDTDAWRAIEVQTKTQPRRSPVVELAEEACEVDAGEKIEDEDTFDTLSKKLHRNQQRNREQLLEDLMQQQSSNDALVNELQQKRDTERGKLIKDIAFAEANSTLSVDRLLNLRKSIRPPDDHNNQSNEQREQIVILEEMRVCSSELQRSKVLERMSEQVSHEYEQIAAYGERRGREHGQLMRHIEADSRRLQRAVVETDADRANALQRIVNDERLQRAAVATLIDRGDGQSWALVEQVRLIEAQLVRMTREELQRRQTSADDQMNKLCEQRMDLTSLLAELLDQQERRKSQLLDSLHKLEADQRDQHQDFWLVQYQKLLDARSTALDDPYAELEPRLGHQLLAHGVIHLLPFLSRLLRPANKGADLRRISDEQLRSAGVRLSTDRQNVLQAIAAYYLELKEVSDVPLMRKSTAEVLEDVTVAGNQAVASAPAVASDVSVGTVDGLSECVICMERPGKVIFLPCGHLCCCEECQQPLELCPMCRSAVERRIKVIQS